MKAKRLTAAILAGIMALSLAGCGDVDESSKSKDGSSKAAGEASSAAESSSAESSSQGQDSEPDKADGDEFELLQGLIGKKPDDARALISERIPQAKEDDNSPLTEGDLLGYLYTGDMEIGGVSFSFMTLMADKDGKAVKSIMLVANDNPEQKEISGEEEYKNAEKTYEKLLKALTEDFGEPETRKEQGDFTLTESRWKDKQVTLKLACYKRGGDIKYPSLGLTFGSASSGDTKAAHEDKAKVLDVEQSMELCKEAYDAGGDKYREILEEGLGISFDSNNDNLVNSPINDKSTHTVPFYCYEFAQAYSGSKIGLFGETFTSGRYECDAQTGESLGLRFYYSTKDYIVSEEVYKPYEESKAAFDRIMPKLKELLGEPTTVIGRDEYKCSAWEGESYLWENTKYGFDVWVTIQEDIRERDKVGENEMRPGFYNNLFIYFIKHENFKETN